MPFKASYRLILYHILAWAAFILYEASLVEFLNPSNIAWWEWASYYTVNIILFYFFSHVVLRHMARRKRLLMLPFLVALIIGAYIIVQLGLETTLNHFREVPRPFNFDKIFMLRSVWRSIYFIGISTAYWFVRQTIKDQKRINQMELEQLQTEHEKAALEKGLILSQNALLQAQISPHLLFNTLNFIYNSVQDVSPKASEGVLLLSEVMHYALQRVHEDGKTDLQHEVEHIEKYIRPQPTPLQLPASSADEVQRQAAGQDPAAAPAHFCGEYL